jgi:hypothetical protein
VELWRRCWGRAREGGRRREESVLLLLLLRREELLSPVKMAAAAMSLRGVGRGAGAAAPGRRGEWWAPHFRTGMGGRLDGSVGVGPNFFWAAPKWVLHFRAIAGDAAWTYLDGQERFALVVTSRTRYLFPTSILLLATQSHRRRPSRIPSTRLCLLVTASSNLGSVRVRLELQMRFAC